MGLGSRHAMDSANDADLDLFVGEMSGSIYFYENIGTTLLYDFVNCIIRLSCSIALNYVQVLDPT